MKRTSVYLLIFFFSLPKFCLAQYPNIIPFKNNPEISDSNGFFKDSLYDYFLYKMQEPVLSNYYLNKEVYRFTSKPGMVAELVVVTIEKSGDSISITTKEFRIVPKWKDLGIIKWFTKGHMIYSQNPYDPFTLTINKKEILDKPDYKAFLQLMDTLLNDTLFTNPPPKNIRCLDCPEWIFEMSTNNGYFCQKKWSPWKGDPMREIGDFMKDLSALPHRRFFRRL